MFESVYPTYENKPVILDYRKGVVSELEKEVLDLDDVVKILETGFDCSSSKRDKAIIERCIQKKNRIIKVAVEDAGDYWILGHVGSFKILRKKMRRRFHI
ncbi:MAG: hypothetical protein AB1779_07075 [Candidatus Thermoplasmatota archaeon]